MIAEVKKLIGFSLGSWINFGISFLLAPISTFLLSPAEYGKYALFMLLQTFLTYFFTLGMDQALVRFYNENINNPVRLLMNCMVPVLFSFAAGLSLLLLFNREVNLFINQQAMPDWNLAFKLGYTSLFASLGNLGLSFLRMQKAALKFSSLQIAISIINYSVFFSYLIFVEREFHAFVIASMVSLSIQSIILYGMLIKVHQSWGIFTIDRPILKQALLFGLPFVPTFFLDYLFTNSDRFFLNYLGGVVDLGIYSLAVRISYAFTILQSGFQLYWVPYSMERFHKNEMDKSFYNRVFSIINIVFLVIITISITGKDLLKLIIAPEFYPVITFFPFLLFVPYFFTLSEVTFVGINYKNKTQYHLYINSITLFFNIVFAFLFIPRWGAAGAAMGAGASYGVFFILRTSIARRLYAVPIYWFPFIVSLVAVSMFVVGDFVFFPEVWVKCLISLGMFVLLFLLYRAEIASLWNSIKKTRNEG